MKASLPALIRTNFPAAKVQFETALEAAQSIEEISNLENGAKALEKYAEGENLGNRTVSELII
jgi:hypothetical protein